MPDNCLNPIKPYEIIVINKKKIQINPSIVNSKPLYKYSVLIV